MMKVAILAGGNRKESTSTKLSKYIKQVLESMGHTVTLFDLHKQPVPLLDADDFGSANRNVALLQSVIKEADAIVLSTPEYHGSISGVLKNALDYLGSDQFADKLVLSVSSAGGSVGVSSLTQLQAIVRNLHGINSPEWISIGGEQKQFKESGEPMSVQVRDRVQKVVLYFAEMAGVISRSHELQQKVWNL